MKKLKQKICISLLSLFFINKAYAFFGPVPLCISGLPFYCYCTLDLAFFANALNFKTSSLIYINFNVERKIEKNLKLKTKKILSLKEKRTNYLKNLQLYIKNKDLSIYKKFVKIQNSIQVLKSKLNSLNSKVKIYENSFSSNFR